MSLNILMIDSVIQNNSKHKLNNYFFDYLYAFIFSFLPPVIVFIIIYTIIRNSSFENMINGILVINFTLFLGIVYWYRGQYKQLYEYSHEVGYLHFRPSIKDAGLSFYASIFSVIILLLVILFLFPENTLIVLSYSDLLLFSFLIPVLIQIITLIRTISLKNKLIKSAMEPLEKKILLRINAIPGSEKIDEYRFADITPASLFLTAGVTKFKGNKNICLVSRYFQWKLSENELFAVISHEIGHVQNRDLNKAYILITLQFLSSSFYYVSIIWGLKFVLLKNYIGYTLFEGILVINIIIVLFNSLFLRFIMQYRIYNQEINADAYGAKIVGNYTMARTLKKLPNVIPAPVNDNPLEFLGFRIAILKNRAKNTKEVEPESDRVFSRYSNN